MTVSAVPSDAMITTVAELCSKWSISTGSASNSPAGNESDSKETEASRNRSLAASCQARAFAFVLADLMPDLSFIVGSAKR